MATDILGGIIVGGAGGAIAGITVYGLQYLHNKYKDCSDSKAVHDWLVKQAPLADGSKYRSTRTIASYNNLTEDRVRYICSRNKKIDLSTGDKEDMWSAMERSK